MRKRLQSSGGPWRTVRAALPLCGAIRAQPADVVVLNARLRDGTWAAQARRTADGWRIVDETLQSPLRVVVPKAE